MVFACTKVTCGYLFWNNPSAAAWCCCSSMDVVETNEIKIKVSKQIEEKVFNMANTIFIWYTFVAYVVVVVAAACSSTTIHLLDMRYIKNHSIFTIV